MTSPRRYTAMDDVHGELLTPPEPGVLIHAGTLYPYLGGERIEMAEWIDFDTGELRESRNPEPATADAYWNPPAGWEANDGVWQRTLRGKVELRRA